MTYSFCVPQMLKLRMLVFVGAFLGKLRVTVSMFFLVFRLFRKILKITTFRKKLKTATFRKNHQITTLPLFAGVGRFPYFV